MRKMANTLANDGRTNNDKTGATDQPVQRQVMSRTNRIDSRELFGDAREIVIAHGDEIYRLRLTALNKLILTK
jgi:hemin uptake protein HemP